MAQSPDDFPTFAPNRTDLSLLAGRVGTWHWDLDASQVTWSDNMEDIHGMRRGSFDGSVDAFQRTIYVEDRERVQAAIRAALEGGNEYHVEYRNLTDDDNIIWLTARGSVLRAQDGRPIGMAGVCMDVTERKQAEMRLGAQYVVTRLLTESEDLAELAPDLLRTICETVGWEVGEIWRWDNDRYALRNIGQWCADEASGAGFREATRGITFEPGDGLPGRVWQTGEPESIGDIRDDKRFRRRDFAIAAGLKAAYAFPINSGRNAVGVMAFMSRNAGEPGPEVAEMFRALGGQIGNVIERRDAETALRNRAEQQTVVAQLGQLALGRPELPEFLSTVVERIAETLDVEYVKVLELQQDGTFRLHTGVGWQAGIGSDTVVPGGLDSQAGYTLQSAAPVIVTNLKKESRFDGPQLLFDHDVVSGLSTVIHGRTRPYGVLGAHTRRRRMFSADDSNFLQAVANVVAMAIESGNAEETIRRLSTPILPLHEDMLILPVIGEIDTQRVRQLADQLLEHIRRQRAKVVVIDITGAAPLEDNIVRHIMKTAEAARLLGATIIMTGISNEIGRALVAAGVERTGIVSLADLRSGVEEARRLLEAMS